MSGRLSDAKDSQYLDAGTVERMKQYEKSAFPELFTSADVDELRKELRNVGFRVEKCGSYGGMGDASNGPTDVCVGALAVKRSDSEGMLEHMFFLSL